MRRIVVFAAVALACLLPAPVIVAQDASPGAGVPQGCNVIASGLANPRQVAVAEDGTVYVTEAGTGGDEALTPPGAEPEAEVIGTPGAEAVEESSPVAEEGAGPSLTRGDTGQVTMIAPDGEQSVLASGLASYSFGSGPTGIVVADGQVYVAVGGAGAELGVEQLPTENSVLQIDAETGEVTTLAELGTYEVENNPDGTDINPNLYGMALGDDGQLYVADAGGNTIYSVDPESGEFELVDVVPGLTGLTGGTPEPSPVAEGEGDRQAVPTDLAVDDEGLLYIALLSEMWPPDAPSILTYEDGNFSGAASGLSSVVSIAVGPDGAIYASQIWTGAQGEQPGNVLRVLPDGSSEVVVENLMFAHGIDFDEEGNLYVVTNSIAMGPGEPQGQLLRCEGVATTAASVDKRDAA